MPSPASWKEESLETIQAGRAWLGRSSAEMDLGIFTDSRLSTSQQGVLATKTANCVLGEIDSSTANRSGEVPLYLAFMRPHLEYCIQFWGPQYKRYSEQINQIQKRVTVMIGAEALALSGKIVNPGERKA